jgi:hypothetical protein
VVQVVTGDLQRQVAPDGPQNEKEAASSTFVERTQRAGAAEMMV